MSFAQAIKNLFVASDHANVMLLQFRRLETLIQGLGVSPVVLMIVEELI